MAQNPAVTTIFDGGRATVRRLRKSKLVVLSGPEAGQNVEMTKANVGGGRSIINDLQLTDKAVSGTHFEIRTGDDGYKLIDLDSTNGTFVGDLRIKDVYLKPGTKFRVGHTEIQFLALDDVIEIPLSSEDCFGSVLGSSVRMREIFATLEKVAPSALTVLLTGETGTGKEVVAHSLHEMSPRVSKPFVVLDCGAIPKDLIESSLFGHEKGSFTGAVGQHKGSFEQAHGGTIFLDEIGELDISLQPKLLRVLENRELKRVGGDRMIKVDVRVLAATNRDLRAMVNKGTFREDLYYRLSVIHIENPPLRERHEDVPQLTHHFLAEFAQRRGMSLSMGVDAMQSLMSHAWPGNVRELRNVIERAASLCDGPTISRTDLAFGKSFGPPPVDVSQASVTVVPSSSGGGRGFDPALFEAGRNFKEGKQVILDEFEKIYLTALFERNKGNVTRSAHEAGLTRYHLRELLKRHNLSGNK
ncbi:MAG: sigma 54-dependent Fis family transcriptional regulator [Deltaproteobacteria bacterium]|nr:sigma 54-dependent Fis family transcriptional regulator [Deltaproteobacteria bacterium]